MKRRPPRSTLFPYTNALPISRHFLVLPAGLLKAYRFAGPSTASSSRTLFRSEEHTSELQSHVNLVCRLLLEKKKKKNEHTHPTNNLKINKYLRPFKTIHTMIT